MTVDGVKLQIAFSSQNLATTTKQSEGLNGACLIHKLQFEVLLSKAFRDPINSD